MCCVPEVDVPLDLFPLAASPDAIIAHHLLLPQEYVQRLQHGIQQQQQAAAAAACATAAAAADGGDPEESVAAAAVAATLAFRQQVGIIHYPKLACYLLCAMPCNNTSRG